ncbi:MAG: discoidin domain-containing protein, partial [Gammaproteobacteria bacterium]|nr:discoidin domain-containing protein [Gammaproteobacteria bacterium]
VTHTLKDQNSWWQVDLGQIYDLAEIDIWNRTNCCTSRLSDYYIFVSNTPFTTTNLQATRLQPGVTELFHSGPAGRQNISLLNRSGRYVRIQLSTSQYLSLAEVEVFGKPPQIIHENVALNGFATQSSTGWNAPAALVIDGNTNGNFAARSVSHTHLNSNAWWEIDLGAIHDLSDVAIWNRTHDTSERLSNFHILVSDTPFSSKGLDSTIQQQGVSNYFHSGAPRTAKTTMPINRTGRYLRVQLAGRNYLSLAEVEIFER